MSCLLTTFFKNEHTMMNSFAVIQNCALPVGLLPDHRLLQVVF